MNDDKRNVYCAILKFLNYDLQDDTHSSEITECLEVAKQCIGEAFSLDDNSVSDAVDLLTLIKNKPEAATITLPEPTEEAKQMAENLKVQGNLCMQQEKFNEAVSCYSKAIEMSPHSAVYFSNRAAAYSRLNLQEKAIADCEAAVRIDPTYSKAYGRMGIAYSSMGNHARAVECYRHGLELDPDSENCRQNLVIAENKLKETASTPLGPLPFDFNSVLSNPMMQNLATQIMSNSSAQQSLINFMQSTFNQHSGAGSSTTPVSGQAAGATGLDVQPENMDELLRLGQNLAQQMQSANPQLVEQLRQTFQSSGANIESESTNTECAKGDDSKKE